MPYISLRGHTGPIFSLATASSTTSINDNLIFTAGNDGIIKIWNIPKLEDVKSYGPSHLLFDVNIANYKNTDEVVWDLKHHPTQVC